MKDLKLKDLLQIQIQFNPYLYNNGNNNNYPIFQYKKIQINPNRKV